MTRRRHEAGYEQLALDLDVPRGRRRRGPSGPIARVRAARVTAARVVAAVLLAVVLGAVALVVVPYRTTVAGVPIVVSGSWQPSRAGLSLDSSLGSVQFGDVVDLPVGLHAAPQVDLAAVRALTSGGGDLDTRVRTDLEHRLPGIAAHFLTALAVGLLVGALAGRLLVDGALALAARGPRPRGTPGRVLLAAFGQAAAVAGVVVVVAAAVGLVSYRSDWPARYRVTGLLADVAATPARLAALDSRDSGAADKLRAVLKLQDALTAPASSRISSDTAYRVLFISDVHRRNIYPYLQQYIDANDVAFIVNTGDETLVGNPAELTPDYVASIRAVTSRTPMLWIKGNHDSDAVARAMAAIPGVTVLDGTVVDADGLQVYGTADPRVYGAVGALGSDDPAVVTKVETEAAATALEHLDRRLYLDLLLAHEPVEADAMSATLGASVRAQASGHVHQQNPEGDLQHGDHLRLVEGTTGLGGLLADAGDPMSFSILSVAPNCQFTRVVRYQLADPALPASTSGTTFGANSSFVVHYFDKQALGGNRTCSVASGIGTPESAAAPAGLATIREWGPSGAATPTGTTVSSPAPVRSGDETGDADVTRSPTASAGGSPAAP